MKLLWQLAWRFRRSKRQSGFTSFISASSTLGIGLGCAVMILMLSVMNGFERELKDRLLAVLPHGDLMAVAPSGIEYWPEQVERLQAIRELDYVVPITRMTAMLQKGREMKAVELTGLDPSLGGSHRYRQLLDESQWQRFKGHPDRVLLGEGVMDELKLNPGDKVQVLLPRLGEDKFSAPKSVWLTVAGSLHIGGELDNHMGLVHLSLAAETAGIDSGAQGLEFGFADPYQAPRLMRRIGFDFPQHVYISDWTRTHGHLYQDIQLVRMVVYLALTLLIAVACFNIVSTLVMAVNEKRGEIAMLKTMGASHGMIIKVFMLQGLLNGLIGTLVGSAVGVLLALNISDLVLWLENLIQVRLLSGDIYFIDFLPSQLKWDDVGITMFIALALSTIATLYPAIKAARVAPAKVLTG
ncbi:Lipoprotein-releasing system transmembrane protein LolC [Saliniradius amylolyticus]|uniref:Lipoprotein-releasing system transmembrane protein LolC n=1 Tax=Saliniradius amylolyticus TaxID=2183582 RepID=A0A2S2E270_9ALTE|nr:lipoprotein-releasing ABC transporter permease subunit [Saliniradius amylolyticus]AWL11689.1 Lipoprotein-releasing system transmembrane protein LolC [Saliniradius amylolyticus]